MTDELKISRRRNRHKPRPISIERKDDDTLVIEGIRFTGDFFRTMAGPKEGALYQLRKGDGGITWIAVHGDGLRQIKNLKNCARCGHDHELLWASLLDNPPDSFTHWTLCPIVHQPILFRITEV